VIDWSRVRRVHLIGVCGTGMGSFAGMLKAAGHEVTGSDENVYPPMSTQLDRWGIETMTGYRPENLDRARPDLVIVGNVIREANPEAAAMRARGLPHPPSRRRWASASSRPATAWWWWARTARPPPAP
jgi:UDP-N-acetylmuramate: L-alanyl-gamma-D-glutamyl-meso-diaminopimelate ligase